MYDPFRRRYVGSPPWEEVWFIEALVGDGRGLWLRHVITDGAHGDCAVWAMVFDGADTRACRVAFPLAALSDGDGFDLPAAGVRLSRDRAVGHAGEVRWDLSLEDRGRGHALIPGLIERLRLGRHYVPAIADLRISGSLEVAGERFTIRDGRGVLGHIHGGRNRTAGWAWAHCASFPGSDALFEGLSARLGLGPVTGPPLTTLVLHLDGRRYAFTRVRELLTTRSRVEGRRWTFRARRRGPRGAVTLDGFAELPERPVVVRYVDPDGRPSWCTNSRFSGLTVRLRDPERDVDLTLVSRTAAFEIGTRQPREPVAAG